jgi:hypothetical protein
VVVGCGSLGSTKNARHAARLLVAPSALVRLVAVVPSRCRRLRWKSGVGLRVGLTRLVVPGGLMRLVAPALAEVAVAVAVSPAAAVAATSMASAMVLAVAAAAKALVAKQFELVVVLSAMGVRVVVGAERAVIPLGLVALTAALLLGLHHEHGR